jgi:hypothetical protein
MVHFLIWGASSSNEPIDHHLVIRINGIQVGEDSWDGQGWRKLAFEVPRGVFIEGENKVSISLPGHSNLSVDIIYIDGLAISYARELIALNHSLMFLGTGKAQEISGFSGGFSIYDITVPQNANLISTFMENSGVFNFLRGKRYLLLGNQAVHRIEEIQRVYATPDLRADGLQAEYLIIAPNAFLESLQPLINLRSSQLEGALAIPVEAIYDQFGYGNEHPEAIRAYLNYTVEHWKVPPAYLLLVGDYSYDPLGYQDTPGEFRVPSFFVSTIYGGETASDLGFAEVYPGAWTPERKQTMPNLAVGRLPARTIQEIDRYIVKLINYERSKAEFSGEILAIADQTEAGFHEDAKNFLVLFKGVETVKTVGPIPEKPGDLSPLHQQLSKGGWIVAYFGHGSLGMWGRDGLISRETIPQLNFQSPWAFSLQLTCLTGLFTHPTATSLTEALLWEPHGGVLSAFAPTSLTLPADQNILVEAIAEEIQFQNTTQVGKIVQNARRKINQIPGLGDVYQTYLLFGDPALNLDH